MTKANQINLQDIMPLDAEAFKTRRHGSGRPQLVLSEELLAKVREVVTANGGMQSANYFTSTSAEADAYNAARDKAAAEAKREAPDHITKVGNAERLARKDAGRFAPYVNAIADELEKAASLRVRNEGTADKPNCRWAFVLVNHRQRKEKETAAATA